MKLPIPDDWNGEDWQCVQIQWPKSTIWTAILLGLITRPEAGRSWDERSGSIAEAQAIGHEIYRRNFPFTDCNGQIIPPTPDDIMMVGCGCGGDETEECEDMSGCNGIPRDSLRFVNGKLQYLNCGVWYDVGGIAPAVDVPPQTEDDLPSEPPQNIVDSTACAMATVLAQKVYDIVSAGMQYADEPQVWTYKESVENDVGVDLAFTEVVELWFNAQPVVLGGLTAETLDPRIIKALKCQYNFWIPENNTGITSETYAKLCEITLAIVRGIIPADAHSGVGLAMGNLWDHAVRSIGAGDAQKLTFYAQPTGSEDCTCTEGYNTGDTSQTEAGYYFGAEEVVELTAPGGFDNASAVFMRTVPHDVYGLAWYTEYISGDGINRIKRDNDATPQAGFDHYAFGSNSDTQSEGTWYVQATDNAWNDGLADILPNLGETVQHYNNFLCSDAPNASADKGEICLAKIQVTAEGDPASVVVKVHLRWLHNAEDGS